MFLSSRFDCSVGAVTVMAGVVSSARVHSAVRFARMQARARHSDSREKLAGYRARSDKGLTREEIWEQSGHELRWLREHAAAHSSEAEEEQVAKMVDRIVDEDEPLAYVLGEQAGRVTAMSPNRNHQLTKLRPSRCSFARPRLAAIWTTGDCLQKASSHSTARD